VLIFIGMNQTAYYGDTRDIKYFCMYTIEQRKTIYLMTRKPVWYHTHCLTPGPGKPLWYDPTWVIGECELCRMDIAGQDWWNGCSYRQSQRRVYDGLINQRHWFGVDQ